MKDLARKLLSEPKILRGLSPEDCFDIIVSVIEASDWYLSELIESVSEIIDLVRDKIEKLGISLFEDEIGLRRVLSYPWSHILPESVLSRAKDELIKRSLKEVEELLEKEKYEELMRFLGELPESVTEELIVNLVWPYVKKRIDEKLAVNPEEALALTEDLLKKTWYSSSLMPLRRRLQGKRLSIERKLQKSS